MQHSTEPHGSSSLTARRSAASSLHFELPPPPLAALHNKYQPYAPPQHSYSQTHTSAPSNNLASVGNLLTPPNTNPSDSLSPTSNPNSSTGQTPSTAYNQQPTSYWSQPNNSQYGYSNSNTSQWIPPRGMFSPNSLNSMVNSSTNADNSNSSQYDMKYMNQLPPFPSTHSYSSGNLPTMASQQSMMHSQQLNNSAHSQSASNGNANRPPPTPTYFNHPNPTATPTQQQFPFSTGPSPSQHATGLGLTQQQITPASSSDSVPTLQQMHSDSTAPHYARPYGSYPLPNMASSMMPSIHSVAAGQMPLVSSMNGGMMSGYGNIHSMYGSHHQQATNTPTDRPFKCDQCVQSFNRNHDLKRHKRIHLAVKPFPCGHCDKSFSRKDALKVSYLGSALHRTSLTITQRHILVKGCDKATKSGSRSSDSASPDSKSDTRNAPNESPPHPRSA